MNVPSELRWVFRGETPAVLWVGAGASCQANPSLPTLAGLVKALRETRWPEGPETGDPYAFIDAYLAKFKGRGSLASFLESMIRPDGRSAKPGPLHDSLARLVGAGKFAAIIDTNYDLVLRRALETADVAFQPSTLSANLELPSDRRPRYWTLHGDHTDWINTVLDGQSYTTFGRRHPLAIHQLEVYLRQRPVLFVGCSMQDQRVLNWLTALKASARKGLHGLIALLTSGARKELEVKAQTDTQYKILLDHLSVVELPAHDALPRWFGELAADHARPAVPVRSRALLVGRDDELAKLRQRVLAPECRVAVLGPPGVGKSTLTRALRHDGTIIQRYADHRYFIPLSGLDSADAALGSIAAQLGVSGSPSELAARVADRLSARPTLLVLDNLETAWHRDEAGVEAMLDCLPTDGVALLVTIRGSAWPSGVLRESLELDRLSHEASRTLFLRHAPQHTSAGKILDELLQDLDGIPLLIELLARQAQTISLQALTRAWAHRRDCMLSAWASALAISYESPKMTKDTRELLELLAELPGGVALDDYDVVLGEQWPESLCIATGLGLAQEREGRLQMHALVREAIAREHPADPARLERARIHYLALARELGPKPGGEGGRNAARRLSSELANIEAAVLAELASADTTGGIEATLALRKFGLFAGGAIRRLLETAAQVANQIHDSTLSARCIESLADIELARSGHNRARAHYDEASRVYESLGDARGEARCNWSLGDVALKHSELEVAGQHFGRALSLYTRIDDNVGVANCIRSLGNVAFQRGDLDTALERFNQATDSYIQANDLLGQANSLKSLANVALMKGDTEQASKLFGHAKPLFDAIGSARGQANCIQGLVPWIRGFLHKSRTTPGPRGPSWCADRSASRIRESRRRSSST